MYPILGKNALSMIVSFYARNLNVTTDDYFDQKSWLQKTLDFLEGHQFETEVAQAKYHVRKGKNIKDLEKMLGRIEKDEQKTNRPEVIKLGRGVETMFRVTLRNHNHLSRIADNKASIMISINAIMISIIFSALVPKLDKNPNLLIPTLLILAVCVIAIIFCHFIGSTQYHEIYI